MTNYLGEIAPHGGVLIDRTLGGVARNDAIARASNLKKIALSPTTISDLELLATGVLSPLTGFMGERDYDCVVESMRLANGLVWSIPITLAVTAEVADTLNLGQEIALTEPDGHLLAVMTLAEKFEYDKTREAQNVYCTTDEKHPASRASTNKATCTSRAMWR